MHATIPQEKRQEVRKKVLDNAQQTFSGKHQIGNIFAFVGRTFSVPTTQLCHCSLKATLDNASKSGHCCVPLKLY